MCKNKLKSELFTVEEFLKYYEKAGREELKLALKNIGNSRDMTKQKEKSAIKLLLS